ncbi:uncharacterized protein M6B38_271130 [Iris pallida]|uniref:Uncharacterized protein n=1 Tax=Iris pallida TaxID=29817 RepID=A0AAX6I7V6_IRIPA|nr:uncharacterized protein M6B38_271130 [Iris pallida]
MYCDIGCYFFVSFCSVGGLCFVVTSDGCLWFGCLSGMETTDVGCDFMVGLCCGWTSEEYFMDVYWKFLLYEQYSLLI